jgi:Flp pilus assembly protein TadG
MRTIAGQLRHWAHDDRAIASIEFAIMAPALAALLLASVTFFTFVRASVTSEKATFTVGDLISRQTTVDNAFLDQMSQTFRHLVQGDDEAMRFRITSVTKANKVLTVNWSYAVAPMLAMTAATIPVSALPDIADGDSLVLTETTVPAVPLSPVFNYLPGHHSNLSANRPRFTATISRMPY